MPKEATLAIIGILIIECLALLKGIDGAYLGFAITAVAGLGGFAIGRKVKRK